jgi:plastocyanin
MRWSQPSRSRLEAGLVAIALIGVGLFVFPSPTQASPTTILPPLSTGVVDNFTLYGNALSGWGIGANNTTNPGPHLYVAYGDRVQLTLIAADSLTHTWFIDYDNSSAPNGNEPSSPQFSPGNSILWNFTASRIGTYVYRCQIHPSGMTGLITISAPTRYALYGDASRGWGFSATNITKPGPTLIIEKGVSVTLTLYSEDGTFHTWFIDYDNSSTVGSGEAESGQFGGSGNPNPLTYNFTTERAGTFAYRCGIHLSSMWGMIIVLGTPSALPAAFPIGLIPGIMLVVIVGVLLLAAMYQVRATRTARLKK